MHSEDHWYKNLVATNNLNVQVVFDLSSFLVSIILFHLLLSSMYQLIQAFFLHPSVLILCCFFPHASSLHLNCLWPPILDNLIHSPLVCSNILTLLCESGVLLHIVRIAFKCLHCSVTEWWTTSYWSFYAQIWIYVIITTTLYESACISFLHLAIALQKNSVTSGTVLKHYCCVLF